MTQKVQYVGNTPFVQPKDTYDTTGKAVAFRETNGHSLMQSAHVSFVVYTGTALVALNGSIAGPFIELKAPWSFDFPIATDSLFIKGLGGPCEVAVVAAINQLDRGGS
jgi:hypothetical protein